MKDEVSIDVEIGFADSYIKSYSVEANSVLVCLECWNAVILEIKFLNFASFFSMNYSRISDIKEIFESPLLDRALKELYEEKPEKHDFRIFKFLSPNDMTALEIVCEDIQIHKK